MTQTIVVSERRNYEITTDTYYQIHNRRFKND